MNYIQHNSITNFIWGIADDILRDVYVRGKYRDVILPMVVIRRLDALLETTKKEVLDMKKQLDKSKVANQDAALCQCAKQAFYNSSPFTLRDLKARAKQQQLKSDFETYLDGFSSNVQEILDKFKFCNQIPTLIESDILGSLIEKFLDPSINLSPNPVKDDEGNVVIPGLDNHSMGTIFEELIRRFNEENNEEAGEHFTPRDVVKLMADLIFLPIVDQIKSGTYLVYDGACGTGGMLSVAEERLMELAKEHQKKVSIHLYGQESQPETYAICKADMERMGGKGDLKDPRFIIGHGDDPEYKMIPRSSDGQLLFLVNKLSKMKHKSKLGSRIAHVHNGSSLFTGDAGGGEANIRRWIIENDWLEAIIALPENTFYNTGIATYIWLLANKKPEHKQGKVQLVDASQWFEPLRKNLGKKNCQFSQKHIQDICALVTEFKESEQSKIFPSETFGYQKIVVERPLRFKDIDSNREYKPKEIKKLKANNTPDENGVPVIKKIHPKSKAEANPLYGIYEVDINGKKQLVEYEPDTELRDTEQVPLLEDGGIEAFFKREVLPFASDAWIVRDKTQLGYEISFTRYFYKPMQLRTLEEIQKDIFDLEKETENILETIVEKTK